MKPAPPSRLLVRLEEKIAAATSPIEADCLRAERAGYLARQGRLDEARSVVSEIQQRYARHPQVEVSAWVSLAEGLISHFSDMGALAHDKMRRSHVLSVAANLGVIRALSAAWVAHFDYLKNDVPSMARHIRIALEGATEEDHSPRSRVCLVIAQAYHASSRLDLALKWYTRARGHAVSEGDDATISALMHNMAWLRASNLRQAKFSGQGVVDDGHQALMGANSTWNFDQLIGALSLNALVPILRAQIFALQNEPARALQAYEMHMDEARSQGMARFDSYFFADKAWCQIQLGRLDLATDDARECELRLGPSVDVDDRAATHSRLSEVYRLLGNVEASEHHHTLAAQSWEKYVSFQTRTIEALAAFS